MNAKDVIRDTINMGDVVLGAYIGDLTDADLLVRPVTGMNHVAWQLGHLIASERKMIASLGNVMPELPAGFAERHAKDAADSDRAGDFLSKAEYVELMKRVRKGTRAALDATPEANFGNPGPEEMRSYAPTVGSVFNLIGTHLLMHAGQFVAVRRKLNKPVVI